LVNLLAGKVNTTDVYNNALNSVVWLVKTRSRQGKVLKDLIDTLTITVSNSSNVLNNDKTYSFYYVSHKMCFVTYINFRIKHLYMERYK
jgi:hypothetical protein